MDEQKKPKVVIVGDGRSGGAGIMRLMTAAALAAGCNIDFGGPGPAPMTPHPSGRWSGRNINPSQMPRSRMLLPLQLRPGAVEHTYTQRPLTKRQKRRLRGKQRSA